MLRNIVKPIVPENLLWWIHTQPDGTFKLETFNKMLLPRDRLTLNKLILQCDKDNKLVLDTSTSDGYKFWRSEGNSIISARSHDYLGVDYQHSVISLHSNGSDDAQKYMYECAMEKVVSCTNCCMLTITPDLTHHLYPS